MLKRILSVSLALLASSAAAQINSSGVIVLDESSQLGRARSIAFVGSSVSCGISGGQATCTFTAPSLTVGNAITGGTANRILYENASNNLAQSSGLTFDGAAFGVVATQSYTNSVTTGYTLGCPSGGAVATGGGCRTVKTLTIPTDGTISAVLEEIVIGTTDTEIHTYTYNRTASLNRLAQKLFNGRRILYSGATGYVDETLNVSTGGYTMNKFWVDGAMSWQQSGTSVFSIGGGGSGSNNAGGSSFLIGGRSTGTAIPADVYFQTSTPVASGSTVQTPGDRVRYIGKHTTLTETTATAFARVAIATGTVTGGDIVVTVEANDATDFQARTLTAPWSAVNKAGTITPVLGTPVESVAVSKGTLTCTLAVADATGGNMDFTANCTSSLSQTILRANAQVRKNFGVGAISSE